MGSKKADTGAYSEHEVGKDLSRPLFHGEGDPLAMAEHSWLDSPE